MSTYTSYSDEQLLVLLKEADRRAFEEIYERYWKKLFSVAMFKLHSKEDAEDIVHDIFMSIWVRRNDASIQSLEAYLATAVKYKVFAYLDRSFNPTVPFSPEIHEGPVSPDHPTDVKMLSQMLQEKIGKLPEKCRIVFECSRIEGKSNPQIAAELHISRKTVEKHISTALRHLRPSFKEFLSLVISLCFPFF